MNQLSTSQCSYPLMMSIFKIFLTPDDINPDGDTIKSKIYESYYVVNNKIVWLDQFRQESK